MDHEVDFQGAQRLENVHEVAQGSAQTRNIPAKQSVELPAGGVGKHTLQPRALGRGPRCRLDIFGGDGPPGAVCHLAQHPKLIFRGLFPGRNSGVDRGAAGCGRHCGSSSGCKNDTRTRASRLWRSTPERAVWRVKNLRETGPTSDGFFRHPPRISQHSLSGWRQDGAFCLPGRGSHSPARNPIQ